MTNRTMKAHGWRSLSPELRILIVFVALGVLTVLGMGLPTMCNLGFRRGPDDVGRAKTQMANFGTSIRLY